MLKSEDTSPLLLKQLDEASIGKYKFLNPNDEIYYLGEYTTGKGYSYSKWNDLISNYKKERKEVATKQHKEKAIKLTAAMFRSTLYHTKGIAEREKNAIFVPVPPSIGRNEDDYDDRNFEMLQLFAPKDRIIKAITQKKSRKALHKMRDLRDVNSLQENYEIAQEVRNLTFNEIWLFDDVLTAGTHFRAICNLLAPNFPKIRIVGFYITRSISCQ